MEQFLTSHFLRSGLVKLVLTIGWVIQILYKCVANMMFFGGTFLMVLSWNTLKLTGMELFCLVVLNHTAGRKEKELVSIRRTSAEMSKNLHF